VLENNRDQLIGLDEIHNIVRSYLKCAQNKSENTTFAAGTLMHLSKSVVFAEVILLKSWSEGFQFFFLAIQSLKQQFERFEISTICQILAQFKFIIFQFFKVIPRGAAGSVYQFSFILSSNRHRASISK
jgi:hypothetical protein